MSADTAESSATLTNPEYREQQLAKLEQQEREREREVEEHLTTKAKLEGALQSQTFEMEIAGVSVEFRFVPGEQTKDLAMLTERFTHIADLDDMAEVEAEFDRRLDEAYEYLAEYSVDDDLTAAWWRSNLPLHMALMKVQQLNQGGQISDAEMERFLRERGQ